MIEVQVRTDSARASGHIERRAMLLGMLASLALVFAPMGDFVARLRALFNWVRDAPDSAFDVDWADTREGIRGRILRDLRGRLIDSGVAAHKIHMGPGTDYWNIADAFACELITMQGWQRVMREQHNFV